MKKYKVKERAYVKTEATRWTLARFMLAELWKEHTAMSDAYRSGDMTETAFRAYQRDEFEPRLEAAYNLVGAAAVEADASTFHRDKGASLDDIEEEVDA